MGFLTPLLWETGPALNLRIGASLNGEVKSCPIHQDAEHWRVCFPPWLPQSSAQHPARWGEQQNPSRGAELPQPIAHRTLPKQGSMEQLQQHQQANPAAVAQLCSIKLYFRRKRLNVLQAAAFLFCAGSTALAGVWNGCTTNFQKWNLIQCSHVDLLKRHPAILWVFAADTTITWLSLFIQMLYIGNSPTCLPADEPERKTPLAGLYFVEKNSKQQTKK